MGIFKTGNKKLYEIIKCFCKVVRRNGIVEIDEFCVLIEKEFEDCEIEHKIYISLGNAISMYNDFCPEGYQIISFDETVCNPNNEKVGELWL